MTESRRTFIRRAASAAGIAVIAPSLRGLTACAAATGAERRIQTEPIRAGRGEGGYGELVAAGPELALPAGFTYAVLSVSGRPMSDGSVTPSAFDGMGAFGLMNGDVRLVRNHENRDTAATATLKGNPALAYDRLAGGGCVSLDVRIGADGTPQLVRDFISVNGTIVNCAGGVTPWGSWLTCEESVAGQQQGWTMEHGYVFEVPAASVQAQAVPLKAMGRFVHEAVAVDAASGMVYETEDRGTAGFYRFIPDQRGVLGSGKLQMLAVDGSPNLDTATGRKMGERFAASWIDIDDPDPDPDQTAVFDQGFAGGAARFSRLEGCWYGDGGVFFHATDGGNARKGQVWHYRPTAADSGELTLVFESPSAGMLDSPDNITVSPRGGIVLCEDPAGEVYLRGLTQDGRIFDLARNVRDSSEFAGACFSPDGRILFVNTQGSTTDSGDVPSFTYGIWGPWTDGAL